MKNTDVEGSAMKLISADETAERLCVSPRSLLDKRYRLRIGLNAVRIGRRLGFIEADVERLITRGREKLPGEMRGRHD
jgi:hypothetical protein